MWGNIAVQNVNKAFVNIILIHQTPLVFFIFFTADAELNASWWVIEIFTCRRRKTLLKLVMNLMSGHRYVLLSLLLLLNPEKFVIMGNPNECNFRGEKEILERFNFKREHKCKLFPAPLFHEALED